jgi:hypothetical protein
MRQSHIDIVAALGYWANIPDINQYGLMAILFSDDRGDERLMFGFPKLDDRVRDGLMLDVPGYAEPVTIEWNGIISIVVPSQRLANEGLSLGFLGNILPEERKGWLEAYLHISNRDLYGDVFRLFPGLLYDHMPLVRNYCRDRILSLKRWTLIVSPSVYQGGVGLQYRVVVPDNGTIGLDGYFGAIPRIMVPDFVGRNIRSQLASIKDPEKWETIRWEEISQMLHKSLFVIVYDRGDSPIGFVRIAEHVFVPAF